MWCKYNNITDWYSDSSYNACDVDRGSSHWIDRTVETYNSSTPMELPKYSLNSEVVL